MSLSDKLKQPFRDDQISWRVGSTTKDKSKGMALAYIDARDVMDRFDEACGPEGWQCRYVDAGTATTCCEIGVLIGDQWVWKANGAGKTDVEGEKGAYSDALKRAAVCWGVGRYLYGLGAPWVPLKSQGRSYIIDPSAKGKLDATHAQYVKGIRVQDAPPIEPVPSAELTALSDDLAAINEKPALDKWMADNKTRVEALVEFERAAIKRMCGAKLQKFKEQEAQNVVSQ